MRRFVLLTTLFSSLAFGQIESVIKFSGQNAEVVKIDKTVSYVRQVPVEVPDTCTRQVPYEHYECNEVTRYREACTWVPADQRCWDEPEQVCRTVTRTRQDCSNGPGRRVCVDIPVRQVCTERPSRQECRTVTRTREECSTGSGRQVCTNTPSREVCTDRPSRQVCTTRPNGTQHCTTVGGGRSCQQVGGGQHCTTVPGERTCRQVPYNDQVCTTVGGGQSCTTVGGGQTCRDEEGPRVCRDVPYTDQECSTVSRRRCEEVPGHNECRDVPYTENVCGNVTRYNTESYACTRTEQRNETVTKPLRGEINVSFNTNGLVEEFPLALLLNQAAAGEKFTLNTVLKKEPKVLVVKKKAQVKTTETEKEVTLAGNVAIEILSATMVTPSFPQEFSEVSLDEETGLLTLTFKGQISATGAVDLSVSRKSWLGRRSQVATLKVSYPSEKVKLEGDKLVVNLASELEGKLNKLELDLKLSAAVSVEGEILNAKKPTTEAVYENLQITLE